MALIFSTRRRLRVVGDNETAARLAQPYSVADVLAQSLTRPTQLRADNENSLGPLRRDPARPKVPDGIMAKAHAGLVGTSLVNPVKDPADPRLIERFGAHLCLKHRVMPWRRTAGRVVVLAASSRDFLRVRDALIILFGPVHLAIATPAHLDTALSKTCHKALMYNAENRTKAEESCRAWDPQKAMVRGAIALVLTVLCMMLWPKVSFFALCAWAVFTLLLSTLLKVAAAIIHLRARPKAPPPSLDENRLPIVTILVPLFRERDIAGALVQRLSRLDYPTDKLDVCLVLEADDATTQDALLVAKLPHWMRAIHVPLGTLQTKPRALNYALNFAKGSIIGVYDAEDAPAPDQIHKVVSRFAQADPNLACLQGQLDFYNANSNWLARCFTIEYATWFRVILPALERLKLAIPLGGTTLFFRRGILEKLGGWDAHNVTEDADLGIRLTRHGYRTEIIQTVTQEEANARAWPWVKQRSRWLKGYAITYGVHMRNPVRLWRDLGAWRFFGVQLLFGGTISQFLLAPLLWSFWLMVFGLPHPLDGVLDPTVALVFAGLFVGCEVVGILVAALAVTSAKKPNLIKWAPTLHFYFPLAALAAYKGVLELATKPFYWDKTAHGLFDPTCLDEPDATAPLQPLQHPA